MSSLRPLEATGTRRQSVEDVELSLVISAVAVVISVLVAGPAGFEARGFVCRLQRFEPCEVSRSALVGPSTRE